MHRRSPGYDINHIEVLPEKRTERQLWLSLTGSGLYLGLALQGQHVGAAPGAGGVPVCPPPLAARLPGAV